MRSELKIGIVVGVVLVVGIIIFVVKNAGNGKDPDNASNSDPDKTSLQANKPITNNPPTPTNPPPTEPTDPLPVEPEDVEVVINDNNNPPNDPGQDVVPVVNEIPKPIEPVVIEPIVEIKKPRYHVVQKGESLYTISELYFGQGNQTKGTQAIQQANPERIKDINTIHPGWRIRIPYPEDITP
jgi:LysM domain-containing protein